MIEVSVKCVIKEPVTSRYVMILETYCGDYLIPVYIGEHEAETIYTNLHHIENPRPMTFDFVSSIISSLENIKPERIYITSAGKGNFSANFVIKSFESEKSIDCRPSDAVALGIKLGVPMYVSVDALGEADSRCISRSCLDSRDEEILSNLLPDHSGNFWNY